MFCLIVPYVFRPKKIASPSSGSEFLSRMMSLVCRFISAPDAIATPISALASANESLMPSPAIITTFLFFCAELMKSSFSCGVIFDLYSSMPSCAATVAAAFSLSPVSITTFNPCALTFCIVSFAPAFILSSSSKIAFSSPSSAYPNTVFWLSKSHFTPCSARYSKFPPTICLPSLIASSPFERISFTPSIFRGATSKNATIASETGCLDEAASAANTPLS